jgi:pimeloyl-ACP methyl ester carboxylesterase
MSLDPSVRFLTRPDGARLAYRARPGRPASPTVLWLGGFMSDMEGTKATALDAAATRAFWPFLRFDYAAHGRSDGAPEASGIGRWLADSLAVIDSLTQGPLVLVGSSMGSWMAMLAAKARPERMAGLVLLAPAADFTEALMRPRLPDEARRILDQGGTWPLPMEYGLPAFPLTRRFFEEARANLLLGTALPFAGPVRILQGMQDPDVPWRHALAVAETLASPDLVLTLIKSGDHRLSSPADLARLTASVEEVLALASGA